MWTCRRRSAHPDLGISCALRRRGCDGRLGPIRAHAPRPRICHARRRASCRRVGGRARLLCRPRRPRARVTDFPGAAVRPAPVHSGRCVRTRRQAQRVARRGQARGARAGSSQSPALRPLRAGRQPRLQRRFCDRLVHREARAAQPGPAPRRAGGVRAHAAAQRSQALLRRGV
jgi:hypothetical protein